MSNCKAVLDVPALRAGSQRLKRAILPISNKNLPKSFQVLANTEKMLGVKDTRRPA